MASEIQNLKEKLLLFTVDRKNSVPNAGPRPAYATRMGSRPSSQWLGWPNGPAPSPSWAVSSPRGSRCTAAVDRQIDG
jgi:hypothetical protein